MRESFPDYDSHWRSGARKMMDHVYGGLAGEKAYFVDKTPPYSLIAKEIVETFPDAKFVFLWRNPFAIVRSIHETWEGGRWNTKRWEVDLDHGYQRLFELMALYPDKIHVVHYEEMIRNLSQVIQKMWNALGLPSEAPDESCLQKRIDLWILGRPVKK